MIKKICMFNLTLALIQNVNAGSDGELILKKMTQLMLKIVLKV